MEDKKTQTVVQGHSYTQAEQLGYQPTVDKALGKFRLIELPSTAHDDDLIFTETIQIVDDMHIRTDYILHPRSAIRRTNNGRFSVEATEAQRLDDLTNLYLNPRFAKEFLGDIPRRFLTEDGWELFILKGHEILEVNSQPYEKCKDCHETMPAYWPREGGDYLRPRENIARPTHFREIRTFKLKTPLQVLLRGTGMVVTRIDHPCYHSLQELLRPQHASSVDPPRLTPVFPEDLSF